MSGKHFSSRDEFERFMQAIDAQMRAESIPIEGRELKAASLASQQLGINLPIAPLPDRKAMEGVYIGADLTLHLREWIQARYGKKLNMDWGPGTVPVLIDGDLYGMSLPLIFGGVRVVANPGTHGKYPGRNSGAQPTPVCNVLDCIDGLTTVLSGSLSKDILELLVKLFCTAHENLGWIKSVPPGEMIDAAQADLASASQRILGTPAHYGLSRWSSLQAAEKFNKVYISTKGGNFDKTHDLIVLNNAACNHGFKGISSEFLYKITCSAAVRYEGSSTLYEAFDAYWAALEACGLIAREIALLNPKNNC